ncbi:hypothetical protein KUV57_12100 [Epibacterium sp. DP7N7-1]|nr:hypothetical protein [Epibacterium sp. DP7N7-1]
MNADTAPDYDKNFNPASAADDVIYMGQRAYVAKDASDAMVAALLSRERISSVLRDYRQVEVCDEDGSDHPLVDTLSLDGHGIDMGEREIENIADTLASHLIPADASQARAEADSIVWNAALDAALDCCEPHEDDDRLDRQAKRECRDAIAILKKGIGA